MATTLTTEHFYTGDGSTTDFAVSFTYLKAADVKATLDHVATTAYTLPNAGIVRFNTAPASGVAIRVYRDTDVDAARFVLASGSSVKSNELNENYDQLLFADQEMVDETGLSNEAVSTAKIRDLNVTTVKLADLNVTNAKIGPDAVTNDKIADNSIAIEQMQDNSVDTPELVDAAVTNQKLDDNSVSLSKMQDNSVDTPELVNASVTNDKLDDNSVSLSKMQDNSVDTPELVNLSVHTSKLNTYAVTNTKLATDSVSTVKVQDDAITEPKLAANSVTNRQIADGSIDGAKLTDGTLDISKIKADDIITTAEQNAGSPSWAGLDDALATVGALEKRHDVLYQSQTPSGTDWQIGKLWYDHAGDQTLSVWNGSNWLGISSGGTFVTQPTVIWVDGANGVDTNDGHRIIDAMKTIKAAVASADHGDIILVAPGVYRETAPIDVTKNNVSIIGQSLRSCFVHPTPATEENTLFRVNSGTQIANFSMAGMKASGTRGGHAVDNDSTYGLPANQGWAISFYPNSVIYKSPYIQNCTTFMDSGIYNHTEAEYNADNSLGGFFDPNNVNQGGFGGDRTSSMTGGGLFINGDDVSSTSPLRSMVVDSFTQINLDGPGALVCNNAYAQFVSFFGTFTHYHCKSLNGGRVNLSNCTTDYGRYGLIADGKSSSPLYTSTAQAAASTNDTYVDIAVATAPSSWFGSGTHATRPTDDMLMEIGSNLYTITGSTTLGTEQNPTGYRVNIVRTRASNRSINDGLIANVASGATVNFYFRSYISSGGHTFEYVGAGTDYDAAPENGGQPVEANRVVERNNGAVWQSSTDHNGKFTVGNFMVVDQKSGLCTINNINGLAFPASDGQQNQVLSTDGAGTLSWQALNSLGGTGSQVLISNTAPTASSYDEGTLWWNSDDADGSLYVNYDDPAGAGASGKIWVAATPQGAGGSGINNLSEDTSPELGGNLDVLTSDIVSSSNRDIDLDPNGSGSVVVKGNSTRGSGDITLNCEFNSHGVKLKGPAHSAGANYTMTLPTAMPSSTGKMLTSDTNGNLSFADPVPSSSITSTELANGAVTSDKLAAGSVTSAKLANDITIAGNLTVNGTTTTVNSTTLTVDDKNIELGSVSTPSDTTADGGGITLKGATDKTITWSNSTDSWTFNQPVVISPGGTERLRVGSLGQVGIAGANYGTTGQVLMSGGASAAPIWGDVSASPSFEATASGTLANGDTVILQSDGTVKAVTRTQATEGIGSQTRASSNNNGMLPLGACYVPDSNAVVVFSGNNSNYKLYATAGTVSGNTITFGSEIDLTFTSGRPDTERYNFSCCYDTNANKIVIAYRDVNNSNKGTCRVLSLSGTTITNGSPIVFNNASTDHIATVFDSSQNKVVIFFRNGGNSNYSTYVVGTVSTSSNTASFTSGTTTNSTDHYQDHSAVFDPSANKILLAFYDDGQGDSYVRKCSLSGNTLTVGYRETFKSGRAQYVQTAWHPANNELYISYANGSNGYGEIVAMSMTSTGTGFQKGVTRTFETNSGYYHDIAYHPIAKRIDLVWVDGGGSYKYVGVTSDGAATPTLTIPSEQCIMTSGSCITTERPFIVLHEQTNKFVFFYRHLQASGTAYLKTHASVYQPGYDVTNLTTDNFIGISDAAYSDGQTATIQVIGAVDDAQSGLTIGKTHYIQKDGSLATTADTPSVAAGLAVSATKLLIK